MNSFADYRNRLERGRTYVRTNAVCHLEIGAGHILGLVSGSQLYTVNITVQPLDRKKWQHIVRAAQDHVPDLLELLQGRLPKKLITAMCDTEEGLFPAVNEIKFSCTCPDDASMCKHVAATLYGTGNRLDFNPELLFTLRGVNAEDLLRTHTMLSSALPENSQDILETDDLGALFGIELSPDLSE